MSKKDLEKILKENGYVPDRYVRHGEIWRKGNKTILIGRKSCYTDPRAGKNVLSLIRKQLKEIEDESRKT